MLDNPDPAQPRTCHGCGGTCSCVTTVATQELQPLVAELRGYLEALARSGGADPRLLAAATAASDRARARIDALAAHGAVDRPAQRRTLPLGPLAATVADSLQEELAARGLVMQIGMLPSVTGDARQLYQALVVLVRLVAADSDRGTTITIEVSHRSHEWQLHIGTRPAPGHAADTPRRPSLALLPGIELMTAQRVAEAHDGRVWSDDPTGSGHTLHLSIADAIHDPAAAARPTGDVYDLRPAG